MSKPAAGMLLAPLRWHTEDVAVHTLAATASRIALSIGLSLRIAVTAPGSAGGWAVTGEAAWPGSQVAAKSRPSRGEVAVVRLAG